MKTLAIIALVIGWTACKAPVGVENVMLPPDSAAQCQSQCASIGLELGAVAIMADNVGCVCQAGGGVPEGGATAGMATMMLQAQAAENKRAQQSQQSQQSGD